MTSPVLRLSGAAVGYGRASVLHGIDVEVQPGELVGIVGPSGSGKTTLLRLLTGHASLLAGTAEVHGRPLDRRRPPRVGYVPQVTDGDLDFPLTVRDAVLLGATADSGRGPRFAATEHDRADGLLSRLGIADVAGSPLHQLSGGQRQRAWIARALMHRVDLLLLDEPTSGVDLQVRADVLELLAELRRDRDLTILLTTHDLNWVAAHLPRIVCVNETVIADGAPEEVFEPGVLEATYGTRMRIVRDGGRLLLADEVAPGLQDGVS